MTGRRSEKKHPRRADGGGSRQGMSRRKRDRVRDAARKVIERRREVLEELAKR